MKNPRAPMITNITLIEPLFRMYQHEWQYFVVSRLGETKHKVAQHYLGIIYQFTWESRMQYGASTKSVLSNLLRQLKRFSRYLQSYFLGAYA